MSLLATRHSPPATLLSSPQSLINLIAGVEQRLRGHISVLLVLIVDGSNLCEGGIDLLQSQTQQRIGIGSTRRARSRTAVGSSGLRLASLVFSTLQIPR